MDILSLIILFLVSSASATEYVLNSSSIEQFKNGIHYSGEDELLLIIEDNVTIQSSSNVGIQSAAPVTISSPANSTLTIIINNDSEMLYGIKAPSVSVGSGVLDITVNGNNTGADSIAFGIRAESGNISISGGKIITNVNTTGHKNKGISASRFVIITGGIIDANPHGGTNTYGLDGGNGGAGTGGVMISGGCISVFSTGGAIMNMGVDAKFGMIGISGNPVILIYANESGTENYPYNPDITISGDNAVVFTSTGGIFTLRKNAVLTQNASFIADRTFEIPEGMNLRISEGEYLYKPAGTRFDFGSGYGTFEYGRAIPLSGGAVIFTGKDPIGTENIQESPLSVVGLFAGLGTVVLMRRKIS